MSKVQLEELTRIEETLHAAGFKLTPQRKATVKILLEHHKEHLSAEEVYVFLTQKEPDIGLATVYRTLDILTEIKVVNKITFEDGIARFDLVTQDKGHFHHHLLCSQCGKTQEIHEDLLGDVERRVRQQFHFEVTDHRLTFLGICEECQRKAKL